MTEIEKLERAIETINAQRPQLGDDIVDSMLAPIHQRLAELKFQGPNSERRKQVTIVFADVSGFTAVSELLDAEVVHDYLNHLWARLDAVINSFSGVVNKHIGDAMLALWGSETMHENDPEQAIRAALVMQNIIREESNKLAHHPDFANLPPNAFQMRIGIHTGSIIISEVGSSREISAMGDTVNITARIEEAAPVGGILISHDTYRAVRGVFDVIQGLSLQYRSKTEPIQTYRVIRSKPRTFRTYARGVEGIETRMVGRSHELQLLQDGFTTAKATPKHLLITILGEAGVGKSRLMYEFQDWLDLLPEQIIIFHGRGTEANQGLPFSLLREIFAFRFQIADSDPLSIARHKLEKGFSDWLPGDPDALMKAHFVGHLIGFDYSHSEFLHGIVDDARQIRNRAFHYLQQFFSASMQPIVMFLDDLQWADDGSLETFSLLIKGHETADVKQNPILMLALARPEFSHHHADWPSTLKVDLAPLSDQDCRQLVEEILQKIPEIPQALRELVVSVGEGNPFYVEELVKMLIDQKVILPGDPEWRVEPVRLATVRVPSTLTGVLQSRLDCLSKEQYELLQKASVFGRIFWDTSVASLDDPALSVNPIQADRQGVQSVLQSLCDLELIFPHDKSVFEKSHEFAFKHGLLREVTYETILKRARRSYHARAAQWLIANSGERAPEYSSTIAGHFERADDFASASNWFGLAGSHALEAYASASAINLFRKAIDLSSAPSINPHLMIPWYEGLAKALDIQAQFEDSLEYYQKMQQLAADSGDQVMEARAFNGCAGAEELQGKYKTSAEFAEKAAAAAKSALAQAGDSSQDLAARIELAEALYSKAWILYRQGDAAAAIHLSQQMLNVFPSEAMTPEMQNTRAAGLKVLGAAYGMLGNFDKANNCDEEAIALYQQLGDREMVATMLNNLGANEYFRGNYTAAEARYKEALLITQEIGLRTLEILLGSNLGGARVGLKQFAAAEKDLRQAIDQAGKAAWLSETYCCLSEACLGQGKLPAALDAAKRAMHLSIESNQPEYIGISWRKLANCAAYILREKRSGLKTTQTDADDLPSSPTTFAQLNAPQHLFEESLKIFNQTGMEAEQSRTLRDWAQYEIKSGSPEKAARLIQEAREIFTRLGMDLEIQRLDQIRV